MSRIEELQAEMILGDDAQKWLDSELGRTVVGMAAQEKAEALEALADVKATDIEAIMTLQAIAKRADSFATWIAELIHRGAEAERLLISEDDGEHE